MLIVCSGSNDQFNIEDFYGAGYFVELFLKSCPPNTLQLSDSAKAAQMFYASGETLDILNTSRVGQLLNERAWQQEIVFAAQKDVYHVIPYLTPQGTIELAT
jgi:2-phosphosulfolactate phosphatase